MPSPAPEIIQGLIESSVIVDENPRERKRQFAGGTACGRLKTFDLETLTEFH
jgi:hypothetical protein